MTNQTQLALSAMIEERQYRRHCSRIAREISLQLNVHADLPLAEIFGLEAAMENDLAMIAFIEQQLRSKAATLETLENNYLEIKNTLMATLRRLLTAWLCN